MNVDPRINITLWTPVHACVESTEVLYKLYIYVYSTLVVYLVF